MDITLGVPIGGFRWRGSIPGDLCGAKVSWACDYASTEPVAIPPFIDTFGAHVVVTNMLANTPDGCAAAPAYVSPGVLTLTPTVTCPNPDPEGDPIVTVLDPLYLTITEGGCSTECCPVNAGAEDADTSMWGTNHERNATYAHSGVASFGPLGGIGSSNTNIVQSCAVVFDAPHAFTMKAWSYAVSSGYFFDFGARYFNDVGAQIGTDTGTQGTSVGSWKEHTRNLTAPAGTRRVDITCEAHANDILFDDIDVDTLCP